MSHNDDKYFYDFSEEALIADLLSFLHHLLNDLPDPQFTRHAASLSLLDLHLLCKESLDEFRDKSRLEEIIELALIIST